MHFDMKELKVGEKVTITLEAVENSNCKECFFYVEGGYYQCIRKFKCSKYDRSDHKNVIFKEVK